MPYIRSYNDYSHRFELTSGVIEVPSKWAKPKNGVTVTDDQYKELLKSDEFASLIDAKKDGFRYLDEVPRDTLDAQERIAQAQDLVAKAEAETAQAKAQAEQAIAEAERLKAQLEDTGAGSEIQAVKDAQSATDAAKAERDAALEELAALKKSLADASTTSVTEQG